MNINKKYSFKPHNNLILDIVLSPVEVGLFSTSNDKTLMYSCVRNQQEIVIEQKIFNSNIRYLIFIYIYILIY